MSIPRRFLRYNPTKQQPRDTANSPLVVPLHCHGTTTFVCRLRRRLSLRQISRIEVVARLDAGPVRAEVAADYANVKLAWLLLRSQQATTSTQKYGTTKVLFLDYLYPYHHYMCYIKCVGVC